MSYTLAYAFRIEQAFIVQVTGIPFTGMVKRGHAGLVEAAVALGPTAQRDHVLVTSQEKTRRKMASHLHIWRATDASATAGPCIVQLKPTCQPNHMTVSLLGTVAGSY